MNIKVRPVSVEHVTAWRGLYREEMHCQIAHDDQDLMQVLKTRGLLVP